MKIEETPINGLLVVQPDVYEDKRGYFFESYNLNKYVNKINSVPFVQDNISRSVKNTIRGLHFQIGEYAQGKLCQVLFGEVLDVAIDLRKNSKTYGKYFSIKLSQDNHKQLWIPEGFAHGFSVLSDLAVFSYKCTNFYNREHERCLLFSDPDIGIDWKVDLPIVSDKDLEGVRLKDIRESF